MTKRRKVRLTRGAVRPGDALYEDGQATVLMVERDWRGVWFIYDRATTSHVRNVPLSPRLSMDVWRPVDSPPRHRAPDSPTGWDRRRRAVVAFREACYAGTPPSWIVQWGGKVGDQPRRPAKSTDTEAVLWLQPNAPTIGGGYASAGLDTWHIAPTSDLEATVINVRRWPESPPPETLERARELVDESNPFGGDLTPLIERLEAAAAEFATVTGPRYPFTPWNDPDGTVETWKPKLPNITYDGARYALVRRELVEALRADLLRLETATFAYESDDTNYDTVAAADWPAAREFIVETKP